LRQQRIARQTELSFLPHNWKPANRDPLVYDWQTANHEWEDLRMAVYAAIVDRVDQNVGRLLQTLKDLNLEKNTVIIFLSDNGSNSEEADGRDTSHIPGPKSGYTYIGPAWAWVHNAPFRRYKTWAYEGGISTPLIVHWPGVVKPGSLTHQIGHVNDLMPTCLELAGVPYPKSFNGNSILPAEGRSLLPIVRGGKRPPPEMLFWSQLGNRAVRQGKWKLVWDGEFAKWELYDVETDRTEREDLAGKHPAKVKELASAYERWVQNVGRTGNSPQKHATKPLKQIKSK
jgi:arylsulfatase